MIYFKQSRADALYVHQADDISLPLQMAMDQSLGDCKTASMNDVAVYVGVYQKLSVHVVYK